MRVWMSAAVIGIAAGAACADTLTTLNFEDRKGALGAPGGSEFLTTLYAGVTFSSVGPSGAKLSWGHEYVLGGGVVHLTGASDGTGIDTWEPIYIDFASSINYFETVALDVGAANLKIEAFDGTEAVGSVEYFGTGNGGPTYVSGSPVPGTGDVSGVLSIFTLPTGREFDRICIMQRNPELRFSSGDIVYAMDYIKYGVVPIPLPPAVWAGLIGLGVVAGVRRWRLANS